MPETIKILHLALKKEWFDQILIGTKTFEYREYKKYWKDRLLNSDGSFKNYAVIHFRNGYNKDAPFVVVELKGIKMMKERINWFKSEKYFELLLGNILERGDIEG